MATALDILKSARALIDTPEKWTKGALARDARGEQVCSRSAEAVCFCSEGAISAVTAFGEFEWLTSEGDAFKALSGAVPEGLTVYHFNDRASTTHTDIMALFDRAIESLSDATGGTR